ncbi:MAG TPA: PAS domain S-box protein [Candidatus Saccharimonadales bacterium]|nr:PAS domain S-box protein [Candidatus Saccharimonadales bacterium]
MDTGKPSLVFLQYLTSVFDNIADGIVLISIGPQDEYRLAMANRPFYTFSGYPEDSAGKKLCEIASPDSSVFVARQFKKVIKYKRPTDYLRWADVPIGYRAFDVRLVPILGITGDVVQIACILHDATEREQMRAEISHLRETVRGIRHS